MPEDYSDADGHPEHKGSDKDIAKREPALCSRLHEAEVDQKEAEAVESCLVRDVLPVKSGFDPLVFGACVAQHDQRVAKEEEKASVAYFSHEDNCKRQQDSAHKEQKWVDNRYVTLRVKLKTIEESLVAEGNLHCALNLKICPGNLSAK